MEVHIGFYLAGKERPIEVPNNGVECERDANHKFDPRGNFCSECGGMIVAATATITEPADIYDIPEEEGCIEDHFLFPEYSPAKDGEFIAVSNFHKCGQFEVGSVADIIDLDNGLDEIKDQQHKAFMDRHGRDIELLKKYVYDDVEIKYGYFIYYM